MKNIIENKSIEITSTLDWEFSHNQGIIQHNQTAVLVGVVRRDRGISRLTEQQKTDFFELAQAAELKILDYIEFGIHKSNAAYHIGSGQLDKVKEIVDQTEAQSVVLNVNLTGSQQRNIKEILGVPIYSRPDVIFSIFEKNVTTGEGRLQVELARLQYELPRIALTVEKQSKATGGIGGKAGAGELTSHILRTHLRKLIRGAEKRIENLRASRDLRRQRRNKSGLPNIAVVGFTNVGKSSLFNKLTNSDVLVEDKYFATLDPTIRIWYNEVCKVLMTDTVGFIEDLPKELINAFKATLEELETANLLLHVVDGSHPNYKDRMEAVERTLSELKLDKIPVMLVFNKMDQADFINELEIKGKFSDAVLISVKENKGINDLKQKLIEWLTDRQSPISIDSDIL